MIAYYFPPSGGPGVQRTLKFVKYLPQFGWKPIVLTAKGADYPAYDYTLLDEIPGDVPVYRAKIVEPYALYRKLTGKNSTEGIDMTTLRANNLSLSERIAEWIRSTFFVPDARIGWLPFAVSLGMKLIHKENPRVIYSSAPPYTCHLIGWALKKLTGLPWVADFRDSWIGWISAPKWRPLPSRILEYRMEKEVLKGTDRVFVAAKGIGKDLEDRHSELSFDWEWLPNGYDQDEFQKIVPKKHSNKLTFIYTGSIDQVRNPKALLEALYQWLQEKPEIKDKIEFFFIGRVNPQIKKLMEVEELQEVVYHIPYVSHQESLSYLLGADVALLIMNDPSFNRTISAKLFEYLGAKKPILALVLEGEAAQIIRELGAGVIVSPGDVVAIKQALVDIIQKWEQGQCLYRLYDPSRFERRVLTGQLAEILEQILP